MCVSVSRSGKLLMALASIVILGSNSHGTHDHILLSHDPGSRLTLSTDVCIYAYVCMYVCMRAMSMCVYTHISICIHVYPYRRVVTSTW
jgi:hypothetical protein